MAGRGRGRRVGAASFLQRRATCAAIFFHVLTQKSWLIFVLSWMSLLACGTAWARAGQARGFASGVQPRYVAWGSRNVPAGGPHGQRPQQGSQQHLGQWFRQHQNMPLDAQERALRSEPGFNRLPAARQQRLFNRLQQLDAMPPEQRARTLERLEALERLSPEQREQVRSVMQQVGQMPVARQRMVRKAVRDLGQLPPEQRQAILNSPQFKDQFSGQERQMLGTLMLAQPYVPLQRPGDGAEYGGKQ